MRVYGYLRIWGNRCLFLVNVVCLFAVGYLLIGRGTDFQTPWQGPDIITVILAVATLVIGAVALFVAVLAIWGYATIKLQAEEIAERVARETAQKAFAEFIRSQFGMAAPGKRRETDEMTRALTEGGGEK